MSGGGFFFSDMYESDEDHLLFCLKLLYYTEVHLAFLSRKLFVRRVM